MFQGALFLHTKLLIFMVTSLNLKDFFHTDGIGITTELSVDSI
jgi:hypothetical protein